MSSNIPIMKTGFDLCEPTTLNTHQKQMVSLITLFTENALRNACIYIKHSNRTQVTVEDVKRGLMLEVFLFTKRPDVIQKTYEITKILDEYSSDDEEDYVAEEEEE